MIIVIFLKFLHYLSLFLAGGLGVANAMLFKTTRKQKCLLLYQFKDHDDFARLGLVAIVLMGYWNTADYPSVWHFQFGLAVSSQDVWRDSLASSSCFSEHTSYSASQSRLSTASQCNESYTTNRKVITCFGLDWSSRFDHSILIVHSMSLR